MSRKNTSDLIEQYIIELFQKEKESEVELQRFEIASRFDCVPSQINYVINTRFTIPQGYHVESKRGGGGYIRITKLELQEVNVITELSELFDRRMTEKESKALFQQLINYGLLTKNEVFLLEPFFEDKLLKQDHQLRATMFNMLLERLTYKEKE